MKAYLSRTFYRAAALFLLLLLSNFLLCYLPLVVLDSSDPKPQWFTGANGG